MPGYPASWHLPASLPHARDCSAVPLWLFL